MNDPVAFVSALKLIGAGLAMFGAIGAGVGVGIAASGGVQAMGRNPDAAPIIQTIVKQASVDESHDMVPSCIFPNSQQVLVVLIRVPVASREGHFKRNVTTTSVQAPSITFALGDQGLPACVESVNFEPSRNGHRSGFRITIDECEIKSFLVSWIIKSICTVD